LKKERRRGPSQKSQKGRKASTHEKEKGKGSTPCRRKEKVAKEKRFHTREEAVTLICYPQEGETGSKEERKGRLPLHLKRIWKKGRKERERKG